MNPIQRIKQIHDQNSANELVTQRHQDVVDSSLQTQEIIVKSFSSLVSYLEHHVTKAEVINQLQEIGTPDVAKVVSALESLHQTLLTHKNTDMSEVVDLLKGVLKETQAIPKVLPEIKELESVDYTGAFDELVKTVQSVEKAVKAQETVIPAPVVNVRAPIVRVPKTDLSIIERGLQNVEEAVKGIEIPETPKTDLTPLDNQLTKANKTLQRILEKPVGGGGGGGGSPAQFIDETGNATFVQLHGGAVPVSAPVGSSTEEEQIEQSMILHDIEQSVQALALARGVVGDIRVSIVGGTTAVTGTLTGVTTVTGITNVGGSPANQLVPANQNVVAVLSNINNIGL